MWRIKDHEKEVTSMDRCGNDRSTAYRMELKTTAKGEIDYATLAFPVQVHTIERVIWDVNMNARAVVGASSGRTFLWRYIYPT
ncbi:hypothetical protein Taro_033595 [Colocasia esculenta]|uniref:Uncharacterized protein n=1 Tax=Colocasia esculenta TaxID=4460 RepID=A0A843W9F2_COLES|nr:hypothetical protein [Colocasia esculenta]